MRTFSLLDTRPDRRRIFDMILSRFFRHSEGLVTGMPIICIFVKP